MTQVDLDIEVKGSGIVMHAILLCVCATLAVTPAAQQVEETVTLDPCPCRTNAIQGEVSGDGVIGLRDLAILGRLWEGDAAKETVGRKRENLLTDIQANWRRVLPDELVAANAQGLARTRLLAGEPERQARLVSKSEKERVTFLKRFGISDREKQTQVGPDRIGTTVKIGTDTAAPNYTNLRAFTSPSSFSLNDRRRYFPNDVFSRVNGGFAEAQPNPTNAAPTEITPNRYNYAVGGSGARLQYISSFEDAIDAFSLDVSVAATYTVYSGSVDLGIDTSTITDETKHTVIVSLTKSFGWEEASDEVFTDLLSTNFKQDLQRAKTDPSFDFESVWGTHLVVAQHLVAELLIRVDFQTATRVDKSSFGLAVEAAFSSGTSSVSLGTAISTLKENVQGVTNVSVTVENFGGPDVVQVNGQPVSIAGELQAGIASGANPERVAELIAGWDLELRNLAQGGAVLGAPADYLFVPLTFLLDESLSPFSAQQNLRNWFLRWLDMESQLLFLQDALDTRNNKFSEAYDYFAFASPINDNPNDPPFGRFNTPYEYAVDILQVTKDRYFNLFEKGKRLYAATEDDPEFFLPGDPSFQVPQFDLPRPLLLPRDFTLLPKFEGNQAGGSCNAGRAVELGQCLDFVGPPTGASFNSASAFIQCYISSAGGVIELFNFNIPEKSTRYRMRLLYSPLGIDIYGQPYKSRGGAERGMLVTGGGEAWTWSYEFGSNGCGGNRWALTDTWAGSEDWSGLVFYLFDTQTAEVVAFTCPGNGKCSEEEVATILNLTKQATVEKGTFDEAD